MTILYYAIYRDDGLPRPFFDIPFFDLLFDLKRKGQTFPSTIINQIPQNRGLEEMVRNLILFRESLYSLE